MLDGVSAFPRSCLTLSPRMCAFVGLCDRLPKALSPSLSRGLSLLGWCVRLSPCLPCLPACVPACVPACLPACAPPCLPACLPACLVVCLLACLPASCSLSRSLSPSLSPASLSSFLLSSVGLCPPYRGPLCPSFSPSLSPFISPLVSQLVPSPLLIVSQLVFLLFPFGAGVSTFPRPCLRCLQFLPA